MYLKKKVLFVQLQAYPCYTGGIEIFNHYLVQNLKDHLDLKVLTFCNKVSISGVETIYLRKRLIRKISAPISIFYFVFKNRKTIDCIYLSYSRAYWSHWLIYPILKKIFKINYVFTIHGGGLSKWNPKLPFSIFFEKARYITGVSQRIVSEYEKRARRDIIYTPPLIPFEIHENPQILRKKWNLPLDKQIVLYVGSLKPLKAVDSLIEAISLIGEEQLIKLRLYFVIVGDGISRRELEHQVNIKNIRNYIKFLGRIESENIGELYGLADMYTICSEFEGLPVSLLEAFANRLPTISSDAPGLKEISENNKNSILFKVRDAKDYSEKILELAGNNLLRTNLINNSYSFYQNKFSYKKLLLSIINILKSA